METSKPEHNYLTTRNAFADPVRPGHQARDDGDKMEREGEGKGGAGTITPEPMEHEPLPSLSVPFLLCVLPGFPPGSPGMSTCWGLKHQIFPVLTVLLPWVSVL